MNTKHTPTKRAPRLYQLWLNGCRVPRRTYRFRERAIAAALELLRNGQTKTYVEVLTTSERLSWWGRRYQYAIKISGV